MSGRTGRVCVCVSLLIKDQGKTPDSRTRRGLDEDSRIEAYSPGTGVGWIRTLQEIRCHGIWVGGEVQAPKGTAEEETFLIGLKALLNRARYVSLARTGIGSTQPTFLPLLQGLQASRYRYPGVSLPGSSIGLVLGGRQGIQGCMGYFVVDQR